MDSRLINFSEMLDFDTNVPRRAQLTGMQALAFLPLLQRALDVRAGLNTGGFVSGYRGSPLGGFDTELTRHQSAYAEANIRFEPGLNEDLAATAMIGTQQVPLLPEANVDGVFGLWYGKGPGVDRSGDPFKHGVRLGASRHGGVLLAFGDDHAGKSSTVAHSSEDIIAANGIAVLYPATIAEYLTFGTLGWAMSRYSGIWASMKCVNETAEGTVSTLLPADLGRWSALEDADISELNGKIGFDPAGDERRHMALRLPAAERFGEANHVDWVALDCERRTLGIVAAGKAYLDVMEALQLLEITPEVAERLGVRVLKIGMIYPLAKRTLAIFARGHRELMFVEEKSGIIESQASRILFNDRATADLAITGKCDREGKPQFPAHGTLEPLEVAQAVGTALQRMGLADDAINASLAKISRQRAAAITMAGDATQRKPWFCSGCPHNRSTMVPEGSMALAGIGCHTMALWMDRESLPPVQMGGEGANWIGMAPFVDRKHIFQNLGDGTYNHSGLMAIRAAVAAGHPITYKILYNDAVAMTGGQAHEGQLTVPAIAAQVRAEGIARIDIVTDDTARYSGIELPQGVTVHDRSALDDVQRHLRDVAAVSVLIYDQTCATELRRRRKRGMIPKPAQRVIINEQVCEGCGDCSRASNCVSVEPNPTELGLKRRINQSNCNLDMSCIEGFCPSFVLVEGAQKAARQLAMDPEGLPPIPEPDVPQLTQAFNIIVTGIGGTGIVTINALIGAAAHSEGKSFAAYDMTGLAQKGGAVYSHMRMSPEGDETLLPRVGVGQADLVVAADLSVAATGDAYLAIDPDRTVLVSDQRSSPPGEFQLDPQIDLSLSGARRKLALLIPPERHFVLDAAYYATEVLGDSVFGNVMLLGFLQQLGRLPLATLSLESAIKANGNQPQKNLLAFRLGRLAAHDRAALDALLPACKVLRDPRKQPLDELIERRCEMLTAYQDAGYARRYRTLVEAVREREASLVGGALELTREVVISLFKLMAYKDEYEIARLYSDGAFKAQVEAELGTPAKITFLLAPPLIKLKKNARGMPRKIAIGGWMNRLFPMLASFKWLRKTPFDPFRWGHDRRLERAQLRKYETLFAQFASELDADRLTVAMKIAALPQSIRGFGPVKAANAEQADAELAALLTQWSASPANPVPAAQTMQEAASI